VEVLLLFSYSSSFPRFWHSSLCSSEGL